MTKPPKNDRHPSENAHRATDDDKDPGERIAKVLARVGIASRREVERMIEDGRISINGQKVTTPATFLTSLDGLKVDGEPVTQGEETRLWRFNKHRGLLTTHRDPEGRPTVFENLPSHMPRVISVGRLDMNTEGLLLLTNDGALARWLELPDTALARRYRVRVHGKVTERKLASLKDGVTIDGVHYGPVKAEIERVTGTNAWVIVTIHEGKNREVRRLMEYLGLEVNRLVRTHYGPFALGNLVQGGVDRIPHADLLRALPEFFKAQPNQADGGTAVAATKPTDRSKWAKAKNKKTIKPNSRKRRKPDTTEDQDGPRGARTRDRGRGRARDGTSATDTQGRASNKSGDARSSTSKGQERQGRQGRTSQARQNPRSSAPGGNQRGRKPR